MNVRFHGRKPEPIFGVAPQAKGNAPVTSVSRLKTKSPAQPTLALHEGNGSTIAGNDNWKTRSDGTSQQAEIEATKIPPANDLESAVVMTLPAGNYTAILSGKTGATGVALIEAYNLQ